ncbi:MAG: response regulator transcription factor [Clostridia bacterium]|nr:response regulator transcription factor [Clostridia bacterium]
MTKPKVLITEDDHEIRNLLKTFLSENGYVPCAASNGAEAVSIFEREIFNAVLLDIMLPFKSGDEVLRAIRRISDTPVIIISAKDAVQTKVDVIRMGADDYITKPFDLDEVLVRIEAVIRRSGGYQKSDTLTYKKLAFSRSEGKAAINGQPLTLTNKEFDILELFLRNPTKLFSKSNIFDSIWGGEDSFDENTVKVHISNLRAKLKKYDNEEYIETVWGMGYRLL